MFIFILQDTNTRLDRWEERHIKLLICCWKDNKGLFGNGKTTKKEVFEKIADDFNAQSNIKVTGEQCRRKWTKLTAKHKEVTDHNNNSGNDKKKWKYQDAVEECIGANPSVNPVFTLESSSTSKDIQDEEETDDSAEENSTTSQKNTPKKRPKKKRKSKSSAAEMLSFLKEYQEKKEEVESKKLKLMQEMKEEKKEFWGNLLEVMKSKEK